VSDSLLRKDYFPQTVSDIFDDFLFRTKLLWVISYLLEISCSWFSGRGKQATWRSRGTFSIIWISNCRASTNCLLTLVNDITAFKMKLKLFTWQLENGNINQFSYLKT